MRATKEMFLRMREQDFNELDNHTRSLFTYVEVREENEYEENRFSCFLYNNHFRKCFFTDR